MTRIAWLLGIILLTGCTSVSPVMPAAGGAYTLTRSASTGFTSLGALRTQAYQDAQKFAAERGMVAEIIAVNEIPAGFAQWPQVDVRFRLIEAAETRPAPPITITTQAGSDAQGNPTTIQTTVETAPR